MFILGSKYNVPEMNRQVNKTTAIKNDSIAWSKM